MGLFSAFSDTNNSVDNSVRISQITDSYNTSSSFSQGFSDIGNTTITLPKETTVEKITPMIVLGLGILGLVLLLDRK